jgi:signal transduction histidine kinase
VVPADLDLRPLSRWLAVAVLVVAGGIFSTWIFGAPGSANALTMVMKPNTSACLMAMAGSLLLGIRGRRSWARWLAVAAGAVGVATLLEYAFGLDFGIDQLLVLDAATAEGVHPGRMAPNTAQVIAVLAASLALFPESGRRRAVAGWLALMVQFEAMLVLLGYVHGTRSLYQVSAALRVSQYTASALLLLSIAALAAWPTGTPAHVLVRRTAGGLLARRILPPVFAIPIVLGFLRNAGERAGLYDAGLGTALMTAGILLTIGSLVWLSARLLDRLDEAQRRISADNERLAGEARAAVAARDEFIALAGHELRTPLTALRLRAQMEERRTEDGGSERAQEWSRLIERLARLVETMLDSSQLAQRRLELRPTTVDLAALIRSTVERLSVMFARAQTSIQVRDEPGLLVRADPLRIEQAIENVLLNAAKYGAGHAVEVTVVREEPWARLSVRDNGIGIDPTDRDRIFARFERAASSAHFGGLGLGLYLVRQIMDAHGGTISVESVPGSGSTFHLRFPLVTSAESSRTA